MSETIVDDHRPPVDAGVLRRLHPVRLWLYPAWGGLAVVHLIAGQLIAALILLVGTFLIVEALCEQVRSPRDLERAERAAYRAGVARGRAFVYARHPTDRIPQNGDPW